jgi:hypothetical protein
MTLLRVRTNRDGLIETEMRVAHEINRCVEHGWLLFLYSYTV